MSKYSISFDLRLDKTPIETFRTLFLKMIDSFFPLYHRFERAILFVALFGRHN